MFLQTFWQSWLKVNEKMKIRRGEYMDFEVYGKLLRKYGRRGGGTKYPKFSNISARFRGWTPARRPTSRSRSWRPTLAKPRPSPRVLVLRRGLRPVNASSAQVQQEVPQVRPRLRWCTKHRTDCAFAVSDLTTLSALRS